MRSLLLLLLLLPACSTVGTDQRGIENFDQVSPTLYRGAQPTAKGFRTLAQYHIRTVINLRDNHDPNEALLAKNAGMTYINFPLAAEKVTPADADHFLALLASSPAPVFVHCHAGCDRTGLAVAAYRLRIQHWSPRAALRDLYAHGQNWFLYPQIPATLRALADAPPALAATPTPTPPQTN